MPGGNYSNREKVAMMIKEVSHHPPPIMSIYGLNDDHLLKVSEVAEIMNAHPNSVRHWANSGLLPSYRIGRRGGRRFRVQDVDEFLNSHRRFQMVADADVNVAG